MWTVAERIEVQDVLQAKRTQSMLNSVLPDSVVNGLSSLYQKIQLLFLTEYVTHSRDVFLCDVVYYRADSSAAQAFFIKYNQLPGCLLLHMS